MSEHIVENPFQFRAGDFLQIREDNLWTDLGRINDPRALAVEYISRNGFVMGKPARVIRR